MLALNSPHRKLQLQARDAKQVRWVLTADARDGFPCLKHDIWPRNERDILVAKSASFGHGSLVFVVCGWREEAMEGVFLRMYLVHTTYVFFCTRATVSLFWVKPALYVVSQLKIPSTVVLPSVIA
jgi:hypothetical protein